MRYVYMSPPRLTSEVCVVVSQGGEGEKATTAPASSQVCLCTCPPRVC
jgi:hypothetical protein